MIFSKKFTSKLTAFALAGAMLLSVPAYVRAAGESRDDAQEIKIGEKIKEVTEEDNASVWYKVTANETENSWYRIGYVSKKGYTYVYIFDEDGKQLLKFDSESNKDTVDHIKFEPGKTYYINMKFSATSDYTFYTEELKDNVSDKEEGAQNIFSGIKYTGKTECVRDDDYLTFTAGASKTSVSLTSKGMPMLLTLFDEDGAKVKSVSTSTNDSDSFEVNTTKGEKYYISVWDVYSNYSDKGVGQYTINVKSGSTDIKNLTIDDVLNKSKDVYVFNGKVRLIKDTDYTLTYGSVKSGKMKVTIKGKGNYTGTVVKECSVVSK